VTTNSGATVAVGAWHRFVLHAIVNGQSSSVDMSMDGTGRAYDIVLDDVTVSQTSL
jgi:hypothetical protein